MSLELNLDWEAQRTAQDLIPGDLSGEKRDEKRKELETRFRRTLAVLEEQGVYAAILYLHGKEHDAVTATKLLELAQKAAGGDPGSGAKAALKFLTDNVTKDIHVMLLVKQLWEQTLIYARYACATND